MFTAWGVWKGAGFGVGQREAMKEVASKGAGVGSKVVPAMGWVRLICGLRILCIHGGVASVPARCICWFGSANGAYPAIAYN